MTGAFGVAACCAVAVAVMAAAGGAWARRNLVVVTVKGHSMAPAYHDGERVLLRRGGYRTGDVIMFRFNPASHSAPASLPPPASFPAPAPDVDWLMKRVAAVAGDPVPADLTGGAGCGTVPAGRLLVRSDAPGGLDSRQLGLIDARDVIGVVSTRRIAQRP